MKRTFDTLFARLALMAIGLVLVVHAIGLVLLDRERLRLEVEQTRRVIALSTQAQASGSALGLAVSAMLGTSFVDTRDAVAFGCPKPCTDTYGPFERHLREAMPPGTHVVADGHTRTLWARYPGAKYWITLPSTMPSVTRFIGASSLTMLVGIGLAIFGAWRIQRPLRRLAQAARDFRPGNRQPAVPIGGPREVKEVIANFNEMVSELSQGEQERAVMLAGLAHDLRAPITRMQVRADLLPDAATRAGFLRDSEALSRIVTQFLDFAREGSEPSPAASVDLHCRQHYGGELDDGLVSIDLRAGEGFQLPLVDLDRILTNLIENAMTYGEPPVEISTEAAAQGYRLIVRDHGSGIPEAELERALRPFVRLDAARGGDAHCGLGLAIVKRLVRQHRGSFVASNADDGGFVVTMTFPFA
ncbi:ATP-binding protein [Burkholderia gladioli]|uniref:ATP-binding protein n=1 Tax=Burkholderia gladioli TaxID=28095 RepID=UPI001640FA9A|nr:ATP-binding protein [Burkholderia gladioli]MBU9189314.1 HAMP domain-containing protein [Burkholderia gladioli]